MAESGMDPQDLLASMLALADEAELEVRVLNRRAAAAENAPTGSAACRVGSRIWVVLSPDDPVVHQAEVLALALARYRAAFLEERFLAPAVRDLVDRVDPQER